MNLSAITLLVLTGCGGIGSTGPLPPVAEAGDNAPPIISGHAAAAVVVGRAYNFAPLASDANGDRLTFGIRNRPSWASFDSATGRLSGTPNAAHTGEYANIVIEVSDGHTTVGLTPFSIRVAAVGIGTALLQWMPPTHREDGTPLNNLAGYRVYYGEAPTNFTEVVSLTNAGLTSYLVENLATGTWYFAVTAVDAAGVESPLSNSAFKTIS
ncbi:MAG TPA: putative Ig domain-containing protein [Steroidobacteraceae bacterium]